MTDENREQLAAALRALIEAVIVEMAANPDFAEKIANALHNPNTAPGENGDDAASRKKAPAAGRKRLSESAPAKLNEKVFDSLEVHLEAALMKGHEDEVRAFLGRLDRAQLEEVVRVQRLPGARSLLKALSETENLETVVDAMVSGAAEKVRGRVLAAS